MVISREADGRSGLLEVLCLPDLLAHVLLDLGDVLLGGPVPPAAMVRAKHAVTVT
jgi:hypothetical protein